VLLRNLGHSKLKHLLSPQCAQNWLLSMHLIFQSVKELKDDAWEEHNFISHSRSYEEGVQSILVAECERLVVVGKQG